MVLPIQPPLTSLILVDLITSKAPLSFISSNNTPLSAHTFGQLQMLSLSYQIQSSAPSNYEQAFTFQGKHALIFSNDALSFFIVGKFSLTQPYLNVLHLANEYFVCLIDLYRIMISPSLEID